jgi:hypothetical protein
MDDFLKIMLFGAFLQKLLLVQNRVGGPLLLVVMAQTLIQGGDPSA